MHVFICNWKLGQITIPETQTWVEPHFHPSFKSRFKPNPHLNLSSSQIRSYKFRFGPIQVTLLYTLWQIFLYYCFIWLIWPYNFSHITSLLLLIESEKQTPSAEHNTEFISKWAHKEDRALLHLQLWIQPVCGCNWKQLSESSHFQTWDLPNGPLKQRADSQSPSAMHKTDFRFKWAP